MGAAIILHNLLAMTKELSIEEVKLQVENAAKAAHAILANEKNKTPIQAWLPPGVIRKISDLESRWPYLEYGQRRTCACVLQLCDVNRWLMNLYRVGLTAGTMFVWHCSLPVIALIETLLYQVGRKEDWVEEGAQFKKCINTLNSRGVYKERFKEKLHELRAWRNDIHLHAREETVCSHEGKPRMYNLAVVRLRYLEKTLIEYYQKKND